MTTATQALTLARELRDELAKVLERMDRARRILTDNNPRPDCNWGLLNTADIRFNVATIDAAIDAHLASQPAAAGALEAAPSLITEDDLGHRAYSPAQWDAAQAQIAALTAKVAELERDAMRYRWLRDVSVPPHNFYISVPVEFDGVKFSREEVDAAIDAAAARHDSGGAR